MFSIQEILILLETDCSSQTHFLLIDLSKNIVFQHPQVLNNEAIITCLSSLFRQRKTTGIIEFQDITAINQSSQYFTQIWAHYHINNTAYYKEENSNKTKISIWHA